MIGAADEQTQAGPGEFRDVVDVLVLDESLQVAARVARSPEAQSADVMVVVTADGEPVARIATETDTGVDRWEQAAAGPVSLGTAVPLEHWTLALDAPEVGMELELHALAPGADLDEPPTAALGRAAGLRRYAHLCSARGSAQIGGRRREVDTAAIRVHRWGALADAERVRFVTAAAADGRLLTLAAVRTPGVPAHGEELVGGQITAAGTGNGDSPNAFETVRLSTVFDGDGQPVKAGAELFRPGDELPSRLAGVAAGGMSVGGGTARSSLTLFRFGLDGVPALGSYEIESRT